MYAKADNPRWVTAILSWPWLLPISRIALVSAFLIGGIQKLIDFPGAIAEQAHFGLQPAWMWAVDDFWAKTGHDRFIAVNDFFEHLGLIAGLVLVSVLYLHEQHK